MSPRKRMAHRSLAAAAALACCGAAPLHAQSEAPSRASHRSLAAASELGLAGLDGLAAGVRFSVAALRPLGHAVEVVLTSAATAASVTLILATETVRAAGLAVGSVVTATAVEAGHLLSVAGETIAFVPCAAVAAMHHSRELHR